ncbi:MEDS domain-containing protein [Clostridium sp.]|uniref:MEDS domain-containing protein n=1 Tax=Clostridium sp. TaxID=1506 RepID=UPI0025C3017F|nr:MEDS domain-containing protein [Clostridium sp.]
MCTTCNLQDNIEKYRVMLNILILEKKQNLLDEEIINLSQSLDILVYKCIFCNENLNDIFKLNLKNIIGTHSSFYYYGYQHLFNSMYFYITEGINNNELIYISMEKNFYNKLIVFLKLNNVSVEHIKFRSLKKLIESNTQGGLTQLKEEINNVCSGNEVKEYNGIRWIGQPTYAIQTTSQESFLDCETNLSEALKNTIASLLCIYDTYDYMNKSEFINETVIKQSLTTHSYIFKNSVL